MNTSNGACGNSEIDVIKGDYWLSTSCDNLQKRPTLHGDLIVDVAIVGGGFSGLWTAFFLLKNNPDLQIAIVEKQFCGYGASGRNGGWCSPRFPVDAGPLIRRFGMDTARQTILAQQQCVQDFPELLAEADIEADFCRTGLLSLARTPGQMASLLSTYESFAKLGLSVGNQLLNADETYGKVHVTKLSGALRSAHGASIHPGKLVRGLARAVERMGATIFEGTCAVTVRGGDDAAIVTAHGTIRARRAVVTAGEAYMTDMPQYHRDVLPMSSMIVLTAPLTSAQWDAIGWADGECLSSQVHTKNYLTRTRDGRILYGSRGAPYRFASDMAERALRDEGTFEWMRSTLKEWWPALHDIEFTHSWGGYLGIPRDWMPSVNFDPDSRIGRLYGYTGRGVSTSAMCARLLAGRIGGWTTGLETLPFHRREAPRWEPEPLRWAGVRYTQNALARVDEADDQGRAPPLDARLAEYLTSQ